MSKNPVVFWELASRDAAKSAEFLNRIFDWEIGFTGRIGFYGFPAGKAPGGLDGAVFTLGRARLPFIAIYVAELVSARGPDPRSILQEN